MRWPCKRSNATVGERHGQLEVIVDPVMGRLKGALNLRERSPETKLIARLSLGNGTGNPRVSEPLPVPLPRDPFPQPDGFTRQFSAKTVENWLRYEQNIKRYIWNVLLISHPILNRFG